MERVCAPICLLTYFSLLNRMTQCIPSHIARLLAIAMVNQSGENSYDLQPIITWIHNDRR
jgi:hypothetical protein